MPDFECSISDLLFKGDSFNLLVTNRYKQRLIQKPITMRSLIKLLLVAILATSGSLAFARAYLPTNVAAYEIVDRHLSGFNEVDIAGPYDVYIKQGAVESVKIEAPADMMRRILTDVNNGVLKIYTRHEMWNWGFLWGHHQKIR